MEDLQKTRKIFPGGQWPLKMSGVLHGLLPLPIFIVIGMKGQKILKIMNREFEIRDAMRLSDVLVQAIVIISHIQVGINPDLQFLIRILPLNIPIARRYDSIFSVTTTNQVPCFSRSCLMVLESAEENHRTAAND